MYSEGNCIVRNAERNERRAYVANFATPIEVIFEMLVVGCCKGWKKPNERFPVRQVTIKSITCLSNKLAKLVNTKWLSQNIMFPNLRHALHSTQNREQALHISMTIIHLND